MNPPFMNEFNGDILRELRIFFGEDDSDTINSLLNVSRIFGVAGGMKMEQYRWILNEEASLNYLKDTDFSADIQSRMLDPSKSLELMFCDFDVEALDADSLQRIGGVHKLRLEDCSSLDDVNWLSNLHSLVLRDCQNVVDVSPLRTVQSLDGKALRLSRCCRREYSRRRRIKSAETSCGEF